MKEMSCFHMTDYLEQLELIAPVMSLCLDISLTYLFLLPVEQTAYRTGHLFDDS